MLSENLQNKMLKILSVSGLIIAILASLESRVDWIGSFCALFGNACRDAQDFTLLELPVALWGVGYYFALIVVVFRFRDWAFLLVMIGAGVEIALLWLMIQLSMPCFFCLLNLAVVILIVVFAFERRRMGLALNICLFSLILSSLLITNPNAMEKHASSDTAVVATVGDRRILEMDLDVPLSGRLYKLERQIYDLKKEQLDLLINTQLVEMEAKANGVSPEELKHQVFSAPPNVTEAEVTQYYQQHMSNWRNWRGSLPELRNRIKLYLEGQKKQARIDAYTRPLKQKYSVKIFLSPPSLPVTPVRAGDSPAIGPADAPVTVIEFSDYQCPSCRRAHEVVKEIKKAYEGKIRWVFKDFPLGQHKQAKLMAQAARCADEQGKFWAYQHLLFASGPNPNVDTLKGFARKLGLDVARFTASLESGKYTASIDRDKKEGQAIGISSTPTFVINGRLRPGYMDLATFKKLIDEELAAKGA